MADQDHLARLGMEVIAWNEWRHDNPNIHPDLSGRTSVEYVSNPASNLATLTSAERTFARRS
jgi:hypothetical protein